MQLIPRRNNQDPHDDDADVIDSLRRLGATSPSTACPDRDLPRLSRERFRDLLDRGVLREAAPGTFYLYESAVTARAVAPRTGALTPRDIIIRVLFWLAVILVPVIIIQFGQ